MDFDNSVGRWLHKRHAPGRIAAECLDLPYGGEELFLDRALPACMAGLSDLIGRSATLEPLLQPVLAVLQELQAHHDDPDIGMAFGETAFAQGSKRRGDGILKAHPWFGALVSDSELRASQVSAGLIHLLGVGSACSMLRKCGDTPAGLAKATSAYAEDLRTVLQSAPPHFRHVVDGLGAIGMAQVPLSDMAARIGKIDARFQQAGGTQDDRTRSLLKSYLKILEQLLDIEQSPLPRTFWQGFEESTGSLIRSRTGDPSEGGKEDVFAYVDLPAPSDADAGDDHAPRRVREPIASPVGISADTPVGKEVGSDEVARSEAAHGWERTIDEQRLLPMSWARMSEAEHEKLRSLLLAPAPNWRATAVASIYGALVLGAHDSDDPRRRTLRLQEPDDGFALRPGEHDLYRPRLTQLQLVMDESRHPRPQENTRGTKDIASILAEIRERHNVRATQGRVANALPGRLLDARSDSTLLHTLFSTADSRTRCSGYYAGYPITVLREMFLNTTGIAIDIGDADPDAVIGSAGVPRTRRFRQSIEKLKARVQQALKDTTLSLAQRHNLYCAYSVLLMVTATTHRVVGDPLHDPRIFIPARSMAIGSDKACSRSHITRPLPFPDIGAVHLGHYLTHLSALGADLLAKGLAIGHDVLALVVTARSPHLPDPLHLPLFFFLSEDLTLKEVSDSSLREVIGDWPWHEAAHRHWLSTALREAGVCAEYVDHAMGHWQIGESPLGRQSILCAADFLLPVAQAIETLLPTIGLGPLPGLFPHRPRGDSLPAPPMEKERAAPKFGPVLRQEARAKPTAPDEEMVAAVFKDALRHFGVLETDAKIPDRVVHKAFDEIVRRSQAFPERVINRLAILRAKAIELQDRGILIMIPGLGWQPDDDAPIVTDLTGWSIHVAQMARKELACRIEDNAETIAGDGATTAAFALASAMTVGGLRPELRRSFVAALVNGYQRVGDLEWLMLAVGGDGEVDGDTQRYIGDGLTRLLYSHAASRLQNTSINANGITEITDRAYAILRSCMGSVGRFKKMGEIFSDDLGTRVSGATRAWLTGEMPSTTLPNIVFVRLITGKRVSNPATTVTRRHRSGFHLDASDMGTDVAESLKFMKSLQAALRQKAGGQSASGDKMAGGNSKAAVRKRIKEALKRLRDSMPAKTLVPTAHYYFEFAWRRTHDGGAREKNLAPGTLEKYVATNAVPLLEAFKELDPTHLDDDVRGALYEMALGPIEKNDVSGRVQRARYLQNFDLELCTELNLELANWFEIEPGLSRFQGGGVNANLVTPTEFRNLLKLGRHNFSMNEAAYPWFPGIVRNLRACGMRFGEAWRILAREDAGDHVVIQNNLMGWVKTKNGRRRAPDTGDLIVPYPDSVRCSPRTPRADAQPEPEAQRHVVSEAVASAFRYFSGDHSLRPHHGRHGYGCELSLFAHEVPHSLIIRASGSQSTSQYMAAARQARLRLTSRATKTFLQLPATAMAIGHGSASVTQRHYLHLVEVIAAAELDLHAPRLSAKAIAVFTGKTPAAIRKITERIGAADGDAGIAPEVLLSPASGSRGHRSTGCAIHRILGRLRRGDIIEGIHYLPDTLPEQAIIDVKEDALPESLDIARFTAALIELHKGSPIPGVAALQRLAPEALHSAVDSLIGISNESLGFGGWQRDGQGIVHWPNPAAWQATQRTLNTLSRRLADPKFGSYCMAMEKRLRAIPASQRLRLSPLLTEFRPKKNCDWDVTHPMIACSMAEALLQLDSELSLIDPDNGTPITTSSGIARLRGVSLGPKASLSLTPAALVMVLCLLGALHPSR